MKLEVARISSQSDSTLGALFDTTSGRKFLGFTIEDEAREVKVQGETRIPAGTYDIQLRTVGGFHQRYGAKYGTMHKGMLHVQNVPGFEYILIHCGNTDDNTEGCLLVGNTSQENLTRSGLIGESVNAYKRIYPSIANALVNGESVSITYVDYDTPVIQ
jgi:hypothetical protein